MLVPFLVQTRFEQQSIFFLPSYSSSVFVPLNIVVSLNIVFWILYFDIIEYFHVICTNTAEGQAWKQASLCLPLDRSLWSTIKMYVINNMFVKQSWNKYWLIDWVASTGDLVHSSILPRTFEQVQKLWAGDVSVQVWVEGCKKPRKRVVFDQTRGESPRVDKKPTLFLGIKV